MAQRDNELPAEVPDAADHFVTFANEAGGPPLEEALSYFAAEYRTMFGENVKKREPVYRAAGNQGNPVQ